jgi:hypothetical protein
MTVQRHTDAIEHKFPNKDERTRISLIDQAIKKEIANHTNIFAKGGKDADALIDQQHKVSFHILSSQSPEYSDGPEAWMASQIIATWTAFEAMTGDLWEAAVNLKPEILAKLSGRNKSAQRQGDDVKRIKIDWLHKYKFNVSEHMGTIFLEEKRYTFDGLDGIREAYLDAFSVDHSEIEKIILDNALDAISLIRNNLVHNGGIIDAKYLRRSKDLPIQALGESGTPILIDGELAAQIIGPVLKDGHNLIVAVDNWLTSH